MLSLIFNEEVATLAGGRLCLAVLQTDGRRLAD